MISLSTENYLINILGNMHIHLSGWVLDWKIFYTLMSSKYKATTSSLVYLSLAQRQETASLVLSKGNNPPF